MAHVAVNAEHFTEDEDSAIEEEENEEMERKKIRENLSTLSFEELLKLKEKVGSKVYNATIYGTEQPKNPKSQPILKRENKNRPREISSKIRPKLIKAILAKDASSTSKIKRNVPRDPRFDPSIGEFDKRRFTENYKFVTEMRQNEKAELQKEFSECSDPQRRKTIKLLIQRFENQTREEEKTNKTRQKEQLEKQEIRERIKQGKKPLYKKKSVKRIENLVEKYEELKRTNRLEKHIQKRAKKLKIKDKKVMEKIKQ
ncbi:ribosomal RNA processing protein 36 homolog [Euwallacea fornicatus]|uniref:ribosomal RNA processing protein 36 homolog n=1 Tax=Euwallacea fornicatus TaxID=995702 RepID=UPI00338FE369